ncbi:hypothetical protein AKJ16_DCAP15454 [Drosera capensis]
MNCWFRNVTVVWRGRGREKKLADLHEENPEGTSAHALTSHISESNAERIALEIYIPLERTMTHMRKGLKLVVLDDDRLRRWANVVSGCKTGHLQAATRRFNHAMASSFH